MNITELLAKLDASSAWRKKELIQASFLAGNAKNEEARRYLCRAWVLVMYAHCDNFLKESVRVYLEYLKYNLSEASKYKQELMWLILKGSNLSNSSDEKYKSMTALYESTGDIFFDKTVISQILKIGNFNYKLLRCYCDWILQIDFNHNEFCNFCVTLKEKRDSIAHGEESYVELPNDCLPWHTNTMKFIDLLKDSLVEGAKNELGEPV